jgi:hypothetical protein
MKVRIGVIWLRIGTSGGLIVNMVTNLRDSKRWDVLDGLSDW